MTGSIKIANKYYICLQVLLKRNEVLYFPNEVLYLDRSFVLVTGSITCKEVLYLRYKYY